MQVQRWVAVGLDCICVIGRVGLTGFLSSSECINPGKRYVLRVGGHKAKLIWMLR